MRPFLFLFSCAALLFGQPAPNAGASKRGELESQISRGFLARWAFNRRGRGGAPETNRVLTPNAGASIAYMSPCQAKHWCKT